MNDQQYKKQVALLLRIMPLVYKITDFAVHGAQLLTCSTKICHVTRLILTLPIFR